MERSENNNKCCQGFDGGHLCLWSEVRSEQLMGQAGQPEQCYPGFQDSYI